MKNNTKQTPPLSVADKAKTVVRRLTGSERAFTEAAHVSAHLQNVEHAARDQIAELRSLLLARVNEYDRRMAKLEKMQSLLQHMLESQLQPGQQFDPKSLGLPPLTTVAATPISYASQRSALLAGVANALRLPELARQGRKPRVLEFFCGAGKSNAYFEGVVEEYLGLDPSPVLIDRAFDACVDESFSYAVQTAALLEELPAQYFDLVVVPFETSNWSVVAASQLLAVGAHALSESGRLLLISPQPFADLLEAGWSVEQELTASGLAAIEFLEHADERGTGQAQAPKHLCIAGVSAEVSNS